MKTKKIPMRMCLGCNEMKPKREMIRVVKSKEGEISLDLTGRKSGRGLIYAKASSAFRMPVKARRFEKSFSCMISSEVYDGMEAELKNEQ